MEKIFTIQDANLLVPRIAGIFDEINELDKKLKSINSDIENLLSIWGNELLDKDHLDNSEYELKVDEKKKIAREIHDKVEEIHATGAVVKDISKGLVDFYYSYGGEIVLLCWKTGENQIQFWHSMENGFQNRRPISEIEKIPTPRAE